MGPFKACLIRRTFQDMMVGQNKYMLTVSTHISCCSINGGGRDAKKVANDLRKCFFFFFFFLFFLTHPIGKCLVLLLSKEMILQSERVHILDMGKWKAMSKTRGGGTKPFHFVTTHLF